MPRDVNKHTTATALWQTQRSHYSCQLASISINRPFSPQFLFPLTHFQCVFQMGGKCGIFTVRIFAALAACLHFMNTIFIPWVYSSRPGNACRTPHGRCSWTAIEFTGMSARWSSLFSGLSVLTLLVHFRECYC